VAVGDDESVEVELEKLAEGLAIFTGIGAVFVGEEFEALFGVGVDEGIAEDEDAVVDVEGGFTGGGTGNGNGGEAIKHLGGKKDDVGAEFGETAAGVGSDDDRDVMLLAKGDSVADVVAVGEQDGAEGADGEEFFPRRFGERDGIEDDEAGTELEGGAADLALEFRVVDGPVIDAIAKIVKFFGL